MRDDSQRDNDDRWFVLGKGSLGCLWATMLRQCGCPVTLLVRDGNAGDSKAIELTYVPPTKDSNIGGAESGNFESENDARLQLTPTQASLKSVFQLEQSSPAALTQTNTPIDRLLIATKSYDAVTALNQVKALLSDNARVIVLCNGLGFHQNLYEQLQASSKTIEFYVGVTSEGALLQSDSVVRHTGRGLTRIGTYAPPQPHRSTAAPSVNPSNKHVLAKGGDALLPSGCALAIEYTVSINQAIVQKFFINCAINPLTALYDCLNGDLLKNETHYHGFKLLCAELQALYNAYNKQTDPNSSLARFDLLTQASHVASVTRANASSMLCDYRAGRPMELATLNAQAIKMAHDLGIECPINAQLVSKLLDPNRGAALD
ncbi:2-dehydropantoate 2-reductase [Pseudomonadales bacterium]|nr:2-dehydropantoate 2-reductase [Pseudomonadales bacterium]